MTGRYLESSATNIHFNYF